MKNRYEKITLADGSEIIRLKLTKGYWAIIDVADLPLVLSWNWQVNITPTGRIYARGSRGCGTRGKFERIWLHRLILSTDIETKHRDDDGLNNRRGNLLPAERRHLCHSRRKAANTTSRYKGVSWDKGRGLWKAQIKAPNRPVFIGRFADEGDAARAYDEAAVRCYGEYAKINGA